MGNVNMLSQDSELGNVMKCACEIVHVNAPGVSLHFKRDAFIRFANMVNNANSKLMEVEMNEFLEGCC